MPDLRWGIRQYHIVAPNGDEALVVDLGLYGEGDTFTSQLRLQGDKVATVRALLQNVERDYPHLVGTDEGVRETKRDFIPDAEKVTRH